MTVSGTGIYACRPTYGAYGGPNGASASRRWDNVVALSKCMVSHLRPALREHPLLVGTPYGTGTPMSASLLSLVTTPQAGVARSKMLAGPSRLATKASACFLDRRAREHRGTPLADLLVGHRLVAVEPGEQPVDLGRVPGSIRSCAGHGGRGEGGYGHLDLLVLRTEQPTVAHPRRAQRSSPALPGLVARRTYPCAHQGRGSSYAPARASTPARSVEGDRYPPVALCRGGGGPVAAPRLRGRRGDGLVLHGPSAAARRRRVLRRAARAHIGPSTSGERLGVPWRGVEFNRPAGPRGNIHQLNI
jgi:hypothetical protein